MLLPSAVTRSMPRRSCTPGRARDRSSRSLPEAGIRRRPPRCSALRGRTGRVPRASQRAARRGSRAHHRAHPRLVDGEPVHVREVDQHAAVAEVVPRPAVPARADSDLHVALARSEHRAHDVRLACGPHDHLWIAIRGAPVPDRGAPGVLVALIPPLKNISPSKPPSICSSIQDMLSAMQNAARTSARSPGAETAFRRSRAPALSCAPWRTLPRDSRSRSSRPRSDCRSPRRTDRRGACAGEPREHAGRGPGDPGLRAGGARRRERARTARSRPARAAGAARGRARDRGPRCARRGEHEVRRPDAGPRPSNGGLRRGRALPAPLHRERQGDAGRAGTRSRGGAASGAPCASHARHDHLEVRPAGGARRDPRQRRRI